MLKFQTRKRVATHVAVDVAATALAWLLAYALRFHADPVGWLLPVTKGVPDLSRYLLLLPLMAVVFGEGGGAETIEHGVTGLAFHEPSAAALRAAVSTLQTARFDRLALRARAEALRSEVFEERVRAFVDDALGHGDPEC